MKHSRLAIALVVISMMFFGQYGYASETTAKVPELSKFHNTIYKIWHNAWPKKDKEMLKSLLPEIEKGYANLQNAKLPGILRDKQAVWDAKLSEMGQTVAFYKAAAEANDGEKLLSLAEKIHMDYEGMAKAINPVLKEMDDFHQSLYMLYHHYLPDDDMEKIKTSVAELVVKMEPLNGAAIPARHQSKEEKFNKARKELDASVKSLSTVLKGGKEKKEIEVAIEKMHSKYEVLEKVFE